MSEHHLSADVAELGVASFLRSRTSEQERRDLKYAMAAACLLHIILLYMILPKWSVTLETREPVVFQTFNPPPPKAPEVPRQVVEQRQVKKKSPNPIPDPDPEEPETPPEDNIEYALDAPDITDLENLSADVGSVSFANPMGLPGGVEGGDPNAQEGPYDFVTEIPKPKRQVKPNYPPLLMKNKIEGSVVLKVIIRKDGTVDPDEKNIKVVKATNPGFIEAAIEAARKTPYTPPVNKGKTVEAYTTITYRFKITDYH